jgi:hypothetical protein
VIQNNTNPASVVLNILTGALTFTPTVPGLVTWTYSLRDAAGRVSDVATVSMLALGPPKIDSITGWMAQRSVKTTRRWSAHLRWRISTTPTETGFPTISKPTPAYPRATNSLAITSINPARTMVAVSDASALRRAIKRDRSNY